MTAIVVLSMITTPFSVMLFDRCVKETPLALRRWTMWKNMRVNSAATCWIIGFGRMGGGQPNAASLRCHPFPFWTSDPGTINVAREYGFKVYYGEATRADVLHA